VRGKKVQFQVLGRNRAFLLRFFRGSDGFAQTAGMIPVECFGHRLVERAGLEIACQHRRPRDRLQQRPMRAERGYERKNDKNVAESNKHNANLVKNFTKSSWAGGGSDTFWNQFGSSDLLGGAVVFIWTPLSTK
jgi:hypothetical protein